MYMIAQSLTFEIGQGHSKQSGWSGLVQEFYKRLRHSNYIEQSV